MTGKERCPALPDGELCNKVLTEDNWNGIDNYCNDCQQSYEVFLKHAEWEPCDQDLYEK